ncbi:hydrogen gas-evolving membrane-bound hydrogenase subunit E [Aquibacillus sediminis]|uniref:hydrogen gas-evolving membrane-bound hydrogenase subunit E n=1 Tax=Aquibacillus sediminis TaxID=2574734 RepID=UPI001108EA4B|nr:hydrogen gas-evolving membrane-bound hydrogenase subunit E [Aquibacillus sediminis]
MVKKLYKLGLVVSLGMFLFVLFSDIHNLDRTSKNYLSEHYISEGVQETGAINLVTSVLYDYRAFDTLGEATVLLTAATILAFLVPVTKADMLGTTFTIIVYQATKYLIPFIAVLGVYVIMFGHLSPGGGFVGGVVMALIPILLSLTYGIDFSEYKLTPNTKKVVEDIGAIGFILLGLLAVLTGNNFLANGQAGFPLGNAGELISAGLIPYLNVMIGIKVGAGLAIIFNSLMKEQ